MAEPPPTTIYFPSHIRSIIIEPYIAANPRIQNREYQEGILGIIFFNKHPPTGIYKQLTARGIFVSGSKNPHAEFKSILDRLDDRTSFMLFRARGVKQYQYNA